MSNRKSIDKGMEEVLEKFHRYSYIGSEIIINKIIKFKEFAYEMLEKEEDEVVPFIKSVYTSLYFLSDFGYIKPNMNTPAEVESYNLEDIVYDWKYKFQLNSNDLQAIDICKSLMKKLLRRWNTKTTDVIAIGYYLIAIENLPVMKKGIDVNIHITNKNGDDHFYESKTYSFIINEDYFKIDISGYQYDSVVGGDSMKYSGWSVHRKGERECKCDLDTLEEEIDNYLEMGAEVFSEIITLELEE